MVEITDDIRKFVNDHVEIKREVWFAAKMTKKDLYPNIIKTGMLILDENCLYSCEYHHEDNFGPKSFFTDTWEDLVDHVKEHLEKGER